MKSRILCKGTQRKKRLCWMTGLLALCLIALPVLFILRLRPMIRPIAVARAKSIANAAINDAVDSVLCKNGVSYDSLVLLEKDETDHITALQTKTREINRLKAEITAGILSRVDRLEDTVVSISLGTLINSELFSGLGPKIPVTLMPVGFVETNIANSFTSAGINQTIHRILLDVHVTIGIVLPTYTEYSSIETTVILAESVLLGQVPDNYTNVATNEELWDKINNFLDMG